MTEEVSTAAPVTTATPTQTTTTVEAPVTTTVTSEVTPAVEAPVTTTVLGETPKEEVKPVETPVVEQTTEAPKDDKGQSEEPASPPVFEKFTVPENITLDETVVKELTDVLSDLEIKSKAEHALVQEFGQKAVDLHLKEVRKAQDNLIKFYQKEWDNQKVKWKEEFLKDPDIGGNRMQTTIDSALSFIRTHGGTEDQQKELRALMDSSGLGNNKAIIRLFANAGRAMSEGKPLAAPSPVAPARTKTETLYGRSK